MSNNIEGTDRNVGTIEEDIKIIKDNLFNIQKDTCLQLRVSIENLLNEYKTIKTSEQHIAEDTFRTGREFERTRNPNIINSKIKELQNKIAEIQDTEHEGETVLYLMQIELLQKISTEFE